MAKKKAKKRKTKLKTRAKRTAKKVKKGAKRTGKRVKRGAKKAGRKAKKGAKRLGKKIKRLAKTDTGRAGIGAGIGALALGPIGAIAGVAAGLSTRKKKNPFAVPRGTNVTKEILRMDTTLGYTSPKEAGRIRKKHAAAYEWIAQSASVKKTIPRTHPMYVPVSELYSDLSGKVPNPGKMVKLSRVVGTLMIDYTPWSPAIDEVANASLRGDKVDENLVKQAWADLGELKKTRKTKGDKQQIEETRDALERVLKKANPSARAFSLEAQVGRSRKSKMEKTLAGQSKRQAALGDVQKKSLRKRLAKVNPEGSQAVLKQLFATYVRTRKHFESVVMKPSSTPEEIARAQKSLQNALRKIEAFADIEGMSPSRLSKLLEGATKQARPKARRPKARRPARATATRARANPKKKKKKRAKSKKAKKKTKKKKSPLKWKKEASDMQSTKVRIRGKSVEYFLEKTYANDDRAIWTAVAYDPAIEVIPVMGRQTLGDAKKAAREDIEERKGDVAPKRKLVGKDQRRPPSTEDPVSWWLMENRKKKNPTEAVHERKAEQYFVLAKDKLKRARKSGNVASWLSTMSAATRAGMEFENAGASSKLVLAAFDIQREAMNAIEHKCMASPTIRLAATNPPKKVKLGHITERTSPTKVRATVGHNIAALMERGKYSQSRAVAASLTQAREDAPKKTEKIYGPAPKPVSNPLQAIPKGAGIKKIRSVVSKNIAREVYLGKPQPQAVAIALGQARKDAKRVGGTTATLIRAEYPKPNPIPRKLTKRQRARLGRKGEEGLMMFEEGEEFYYEAPKGKKKGTKLPAGTKITRVPPGAAEGALPLSWNPKHGRAGKPRRKKRAKSASPYQRARAGGGKRANPHHKFGSETAKKIDPYENYREGVITDPDEIKEVWAKTDSGEKYHVLAVRVGDRWANVHRIRSGDFGQRGAGYGVRFWMEPYQLEQAGISKA